MNKTSKGKVARSMRNLLQSAGLLGAVVGTLLLPGVASAAYAVFITIPGIPGVSVVRGHEKEIEALTLNLDAERPRGQDRHYQDITFTKHCDVSSSP